MLVIKIIVGIFLGIFVLQANVFVFDLVWSMSSINEVYEVSSWEDPTLCLRLFLLVGFPGAIIALIIKGIISIFRK